MYLTVLETYVTPFQIIYGIVGFIIFVFIWRKSYVAGLIIVGCLFAYLAYEIIDWNYWRDHLKI